MCIHRLPFIEKDNIRLGKEVRTRPFIDFDWISFFNNLKVLVKTSPIKWIEGIADSYTSISYNVSNISYRKISKASSKPILHGKISKRRVKRAVTGRIKYLVGEVWAYWVGPIFLYNRERSYRVTLQNSYFKYNLPLNEVSKRTSFVEQPFLSIN